MKDNIIKDIRINTVI